MTDFEQYERGSECQCDSYAPGNWTCDACGRNGEVKGDRDELERASHQAMMQDEPFLNPNPRRRPYSRF